METKHKISLETTTTLQLPDNELKMMYLYMSLFQFTYLRKPDYNEKLLLDKCQQELKTYLNEANSLSQTNPNNHNLHKICAFFDKHYKNITQIAGACGHSVI